MVDTQQQMTRKILFINYEFPPLGGGGGRANAQIAKQLVKLGHEVVVMTSRFANLPHQENWEGVDIVRIPTLRRVQEKCSVFEMFVFMMMSLIYGVLIFRRHRPEVVISFFSIPCGPAALLLRWIFGVPYIIALRGGDVPGFLPEQLSFYHKLTAPLTRLLWRCAQAVTANSHGLATLAQNFSPGTIVSVIPNGVAEDFFQDRSQVFQRQSETRLSVITVGRLSEQKKIERQIAVMSRLQTNKENVVLTIVGDGPDRKKLEKIASELQVLNVSVFFVGWYERTQLMQAYREADVFFLSSDFEGMPNVVLEAMASSLAIVATQAPGTVDLVQEGVNGYLVGNQQLENFDRIFIELKNSWNHRQRLQKNSFYRAKEHTWQKVAALYADLVNKVVA